MTIEKMLARGNKLKGYMEKAEAARLRNGNNKAINVTGCLSAGLCGKKHIKRGFAVIVIIFHSIYLHLCSIEWLGFLLYIAMSCNF